MGERKVLNKYFPPDFDPKKVPRMKRDLEKQIGVRMMIPFSMQCNTCGEFMYRGKKFNSLKEDCIGEDYLGIRRFRFYIKCVICSQEITFKTDPEKGDYELETGAHRNFESWTDKKATEDEHKKAREEEEKSDNMKQLENRTLDSKIELEIMDALDEIKAVNRRHETVDTEEVLKASAARREMGASIPVGDGEGEEDKDSAMIAKIQFGGSTVRRLADGSDSDGASSPGHGAMPVDPPRVAGKGKGVEGKGKGKKRTPLGSAIEGAPTFQPVRISGTAEVVEPSRTGDLQPTGVHDSKTSADPVGTDAIGSLLVSGIEAQAKREAEKAKVAAAGSLGTKIVAKPKKKRDKSGEDGEGAHHISTKRKKHKSKKKVTRSKRLGEKSVGRAKVAPVDVAPRGGLNLLGTYDSSSGSDDGAR